MYVSHMKHISAVHAPHACSVQTADCTGGEVMSETVANGAGSGAALDGQLAPYTVPFRSGRLEVSLHVETEKLEV